MIFLAFGLLLCRDLYSKLISIYLENLDASDAPALNDSQAVISFLTSVKYSARLPPNECPVA